MESSPLIFDIRHFALDDGPGIRTTVFLKGCPLSCAWCHNPEGINKNGEIMFFAGKCILCGNCRSVCRNGAISFEEDIRVIHARCDMCGSCISGCPAGALQITGKYYPPEELVSELLSDMQFFMTSSGGVTFSGGEPAIYTEYLGTVLRMLKKHNIHIAIQTSGVFNFELFREKILPYTDLVYFDMKFIDRNEYRRWTGGDVTVPLENFRLLSKQPGIHITASIPLVPGITSTRKNLTEIRDFLEASGCFDWILRPYHPGGMVKHVSLGKKIPELIPLKSMTPKQEMMARKVLSGKKALEIRLI